MAPLRTRQWLAKNQPFLLLLIASTVFRLLAILVMRPGGFLAAAGPDQSYYFEVGRLAGSGRIAFFHFWMEYPPLMPWLAALAYRLSLHLPPAGEPIFWFNLFFRLLLLPFSQGTLCLVYACANRLGSRERALQVSALWTLLFVPFFTLLAWFEPLQLFFLVLGLYGLLTQRPWLAGVAAGLGFMAKVLPIALIPVGLFALSSYRRRAAYIAGAALSAGLVILPPLLAAPGYVLAWVQALRSVSSWESVWALLEGYAGYGVVASLGLRADPTAAVMAVHPSTLPWLLIGAGFALLYVLAITRRIAWAEPARVASFALFTLAVFILYSKGYSPQWAAHLGTLALLALPLGPGLGYALLLDAFAVAEWPIAFVTLSGDNRFLAAVILLRTAVIVLVGLNALACVFEARPWRAVRRLAFPTAMAIAVVGMLAVAGPTWRAFVASRLEAEPLAPLIHSLQQEPAESIVVVQPALLERLRPYLPGAHIALLPNPQGEAWVAVDSWLPGALGRSDRAWLLYDNTDQDRTSLFDNAQAWFAVHASPSVQTWFGPVRAEHYVLAPAAPARPTDVGFAGGLRLVAVAAPTASIEPGQALAVHLSWVAGAPLPADYAVFVQLLSPDGQAVAQSDVWPSPPTSGWPAGEEVVTRHGLVAPADLPAGDYVLQAGLYDASGARLQLLDGSDAMRLSVLTVAAPAP